MMTKSTHFLNMSKKPRKIDMTENSKNELEIEEWERIIAKWMKKRFPVIPCDLCDNPAAHIISGKSGSIGRCKAHPFKCSGGQNGEIWLIR